MSGEWVGGIMREFIFYVIAMIQLTDEPITNEPTPIAAKPETAELTWAERWQSLQAGGLGAIAAALILGLLTAMNTALVPQMPILTGLLTWRDGIGVVVGGTIVELSGFLFAVTYRYIIRQDQNPHLKSGAVGAFGLVRGLALVEMSWPQAHPALLIGLVAESFLLYGGIRLVLDWAFARGWLRPFPSN